MNNLSNFLYTKLRICTYEQLLDAGLSYEDIQDIPMNKLANWKNEKLVKTIQAMSNINMITGHEFVEVLYEYSGTGNNCT